MSMTDYNKGDGRKNSVSDEDEPSYNKEGVDGHNDVVENPALLDVIDYLTEKDKDDLALRSRDDHNNDDVRRNQRDDLDEDDQEIETDDHDDFGENQVSPESSRASWLQK
ncbi:hypothetical protein D5086_030245 [Populus alba]